MTWMWLGALLAMGQGCAPTAGSAVPARSGQGSNPAVARAESASETSDGREDAGSVALSSSIRRVTVYSDRALVTRETTAKITAEPTVYAFRQLPGWVDDGTVRVSTTAGRILDVRVIRRHLARATDQSYRKAQSEARQRANRMAALDDELKVLDAKTKQIEDIKAFSVDKLNKDLVIGNVGVRTYASVVEYVTKTLRETARERRAVQVERDKLAPEIEAGKRRLEDLKGLSQLEETTVLVTVQGTAAVDGQLMLTYMLPGATWEPVHELRVSERDPSSVEIASFAAVTQASGEDWNQAELTFSTQSSTEAARIPELEALTLGDTGTGAQIFEKQAASFSRAEAAFKGQNRLWNKHFQASSLGGNFEEVYKTNYEYLQVVQSKTVQIFQSLQQRGTTAQFKATSTANVRADGRSVRQPIGRAQFKAKQAIVAAPEQSLNAARTLEMQNQSGQPLLPGSVALYQGSAFLGMTSVGFVADGEGFAVFLSVADHLKLSRVLDKKRSALVRKQRTQMQLAFVVTVENLSSTPTSLTLYDRIPVSEDKEITITGVKIAPEIKPDSKGILRFSLTLAPKEKRKLDLQYQIEYPPTLILEMTRDKARHASPAEAHPAITPLPSPRKARDLKEDIEQLESAF